MLYVSSKMDKWSLFLLIFWDEIVSLLHFIPDEHYFVIEVSLYMSDSLEIHLLNLVFQDKSMVRSNSLTERVKVWDRFSGVIDAHAVKMDFLKHVHRQNPPFRIKRRMPTRKTIKVICVVVDIMVVCRSFFGPNHPLQSD